MAFDSYMSWITHLEKVGLSDIIFGVKPEIKENTLYIGINDTQRIGMDNDYVIIGYIYDVILSVPSVDSPLIEKVAEKLTNGLAYVNWNEKNHMYVYSGQVTIPVGAGGQPWQ